MIFKAFMLMLVLMMMVLGACNDDDINSLEGEAYDIGPLEIRGNYIDEWGSDHQITSDTWTSFGGASVIHILDHSNLSKFIVGRNDVVNSFNPGKYSRHDWTYFGGTLYYCTTAFDKNTLAEAYGASANATNPTVGGCDVINNFTWTNLTP